MLNFLKKIMGKTLHRFWMVLFLFACLFMLGDPGKLMKLFTASAVEATEVSRVELLRVVPLSGVNQFEFKSLTTNIQAARKTGSGGLPHLLVIDSIPAPSAIDSEASTRYTTLGVTDSYAHPLTFAWTSSCSGLGSNGTFTDASARNPTWTAPENITGSAGDCTISVDIDDGSFGLTVSGSFTQSVAQRGVETLHLLTIDSISSPSIIDSEASINYTVTATDTLAHSLNYAWTASCPSLGSNGTFANASVQNPTWTAPSFATPTTENCTISVTINDGSFGLTVSGSFTQSVAQRGVETQHLLTIDSISSPSAIDSEASTNYTVTVTDTRAHPLTFAWTASCPGLGSNGTFANASARNPTWTAPANSTGSAEDCTISVTVDDGSFGLTVSGSFTQQVSFHTLTITAGPTSSTSTGAPSYTTNLSVTASDSLLHTLSYAWSETCTGSIGPGTFSNAAAQNPTWTAPANTTGSTQTCSVSVTVNDSASGGSLSTKSTTLIQSVTSSIIPLTVVGSTSIVDNDAVNTTLIEISIDVSGTNTISAALAGGGGNIAIYLRGADVSGNGGTIFDSSGSPFTLISPSNGSTITDGTTNAIVQRAADSVFFKITFNIAGGPDSNTTLNSFSGYNCGSSQSNCP